VRELLVDGELEVPERGPGEPVHVQQQVVQVQPFRAVRGSGGSPRDRNVAVERLEVMLVVRPMELPGGRSDEGWIEVVDRVVRLDERPGSRGP